MLQQLVIKMARRMVLLILAADTPRMIQRTPQLPMMAMTRMTVKATVHMAEASVHGSETGLVVERRYTVYYEHYQQARVMLILTYT